MSLQGKRVAIYARFSSDRQRDTSIEDQIRRCTEHVRRLGGKVDSDLVFSDAAISGSTLARPGFEALMRLATSRPPQIDTIITEDMSRISRDFADSAAIFKRLQYSKVPLVGVADGIDTSARGAKMAFTLKSLMSDMYLDDLRDKTLRGMEGRALAGMATGNLAYGYRSIPVLDAYGKITGHRIEIDEQRSNVVRWIFAQYLNGRSLSNIAHELNANGTEAPRARTRHRAKGWVDSTVRAMLHNERYAGVWRFKSTQWVRDPSTNTRKPVARPADEVITQERPELAIVDAATWSEVKERLAHVHEFYTGRRTSKAKPQGRTCYPLSSILACGSCGAPMTIYGSGSSGYYRCSHYLKRRTCTNSMSVREDVARSVILGEIRTRLTRPKALEYARKRAAEMLAEMSRGHEGDLKERRNRLARTEKRIAGLVSFIADGDRSEAVVSGLRDLEAQAKEERVAIAAIEREVRKPIALPTPDQIRTIVGDVERAVSEEPIKAREALRALFKNGTITMTPQKDGTYLATSRLYPFVVGFSKENGRLKFPSTGPGSGGPQCGLLEVFSLDYSAVVPGVRAA